ncbi:MAG: membrane protein insertion efficiency factor YidD [Candidatus Marinamargulisbacteria bacterium]
MKTMALTLIKFYQCVISPVILPRCRFYPTCSTYTHHAIDDYGIKTGIYLGLRRLFRCHPFSTGGFDPVPPRKDNN